VRNLVEAGNPIYPLVFGGKFVGPGEQSQLREDLGSAGLAHPVLRLPILPYDLLRHSQAFAKGRYIGTAIFLAAPLALVGPRAWTNRILFAGSVVFIAIVLATVPSQARFFLPALGVLAALGGVGVTRLLTRRPRLVVPLVGAAAIVVVAWLAPSVALTRQLLPVAFGRESRSAFLQHATGVQDMFDQVGRRVSGTVGFVGYTNIFNYPGRAIALDPPEFDDRMSRRAFVDRLRAHRVVDVLAPETDLRQPSPLPEGIAERAPIYGSALTAVEPCVSQVGSYDARVVTSRSRGSVQKTRFGLLAVGPCYRSRTEPTDARSSTSSTAAPSSRYSSSVLTDQTS
jgi:hypothetical protein